MALCKFKPFSQAYDIPALQIASQRLKRAKRDVLHLRVNRVIFQRTTPGRTKWNLTACNLQSLLLWRQPGNCFKVDYSLLWNGKDGNLDFAILQGLLRNCKEGGRHKLRAFVHHLQSNIDSRWLHESSKFRRHALVLTYSRSFDLARIEAYRLDHLRSSSCLFQSRGGHLLYPAFCPYSSTKATSLTRSAWYV